jgi:holo-[acyl-carrier protein] synthase
MRDEHHADRAPAQTVKALHRLAVESLVGNALREVSIKALTDVPRGLPRLGVDVVDVEVLARQLSSRIGVAFKHRIFTEDEIADCRDQVAKFATRWAVKEAVSKAIGTGFREGLNPRSIEVLTASDGSIRVAPAAGQAWPDDADNWQWVVSAAHESNVAVAVAVAVALA